MTTFLTIFILSPISNTHTTSAVKASMADAFYFHTTLFRFNADARKEVIANFNAAIQDVSARCRYDTKQDVSFATSLCRPICTQADQYLQMFCLTCPQHIGADANGALGKFISELVDRELGAAAAEGVRRNVTASLPAVHVNTRLLSILRRFNVFRRASLMTSSLFKDKPTAVIH